MGISMGNWNGRAAVLAAAAFAALLGCVPCRAQGWTSVTSITTLDVTNPALVRTGVLSGATAYNVTYDGVEQQIQALTAGGQIYQPIGYGVAVARRNTAPSLFPTNNPDQSAAFNAVAAITDVTNHTVRGRYLNTLNDLFTSRNLYTGTENLFVNQSAPGNVVANVERMDFIFTGGVLVASDIGFAVFERGRGPNSTNAGANGGFRVAAITALDSFGVPAGFSTAVVSVLPDNIYNNTNQGVGHPGYRYDVFRFATAAGPELDAFNNVNLNTQGMAAAFISSASFGLSLGATVYGYAVFGEDVTATGSDLLDVANPAFFPTNSGFDNDVDMIASGAIIFRAVPEPGAVAALALAATAGLALSRRRP